MKIYQHSIKHIFLLFLLIFLSACASLTSKPINDAYGLLWLIDKPGAKPSYIFGTMHSEDPRVTAIPDVVLMRLNSADTVAFEVMLDGKSSQEAARAMFFTDGRDLKTVLGPELYVRAVTAMKSNNIEESFVNMMKPWAVFVTLNMPVQQTGLFLDVILFKQAKKNAQKLIGLEEIMEQVDALSGMSDADQIILLKSTLEEYAASKKFMETILEVYLSRDLDKILELNEKYQQTIEPRVAEIFNQRLLILRNYRMVERMQGLLEQGNGFIAVGALHLPGKEGILNLLRLQNYQVSAVY